MACAAIAAAISSTTPAGAATAVGCGTSPAPKLCSIRAYHARANHYRLALGETRLVLERAVFTRPHRRPYAVWLWGVRKERAKATYAALLHWYTASGAACVHGKEGAWNDPESPYWGGYQMSLGFQSAHGSRYLARWGTADHWPVLVQIRVTRRVVQSSGWGQWPATAAACGLLP